MMTRWGFERHTSGALVFWPPLSLLSLAHMCGSFTELSLYAWGIDLGVLMHGRKRLDTDTTGRRPVMISWQSVVLLLIQVVHLP